MKKSEIYRIAIAAVIDHEHINMDTTIDVLHELFRQLDTSVILEGTEAADHA